MATTFGMGLGNFRTLDAPGFVDTVGTPMYPKIVFEKIGFFDENLIRNQDDDFNYRLTNAGGKIFFDSSISLKYYVRGNFKGLWKQFFQYGYWKVFVNKKHKSVTTLRQLVPPLFVAYTFALLLFCSVPIIPSELKLLAIIPFLFYLGLAVLFAGKTIQKEKNISFSKVLLTFPILHFSYGLGYLKGIWSFLLLNKKPSEKSKELSR
jgi:GT2 family glycosyltransferase